MVAPAFRHLQSASKAPDKTCQGAPALDLGSFVYGGSFGNGGRSELSGFLWL